MIVGIGLFSGGLDSILAVRVLQKQHVRIEVIVFVTPFFGPETAKKAVKQLNVPLHIIDITEKHFEMLRAPKYGYGSNMNPCIDCHALMFNQAGQLMEKNRAHFLFSGEVLGERPMSQNKNSLKIVAKESGYEEFIIRPLSARLLPISKSEKEGLVDREKLLDIQGRSRKRQIEISKQFGITYYPNPASGCRLTDPSFSNRIKDLLQHNKKIVKRDLELLNVGRHLRINPNMKIVIGRNEKENDRLKSLKKKGDIILTIEDIPSPIVMIPQGANDAINLAASACVRYSDAQGDKPVLVSIYQDSGIREKIYATACSQERLKDFII